LINPNVDAGTGWLVGSLVGHMEDGTISKCYAEGGSVAGAENVGGPVGYNWGTISNCYATGSVSGMMGVGGLMGSNSGEISNCYSSGDVSGVYYVGGLVGENDDTVTNCYSTGSVSDGSCVGGLVGYNDSGTVSASFWDTQTSGQTTSAGGTGLPTAEMQMQVTFTDAGWDFVGETTNGTEDIWAICEGVDYPKLTWQFVIGDFDGDDDVDFADFTILAARWLQTDNSFWCGGGTDLTNDGDVDFNDLNEFAGNWLAGK